MANVEGWKVGTYKGEPIYKTIPEDTFVKPSLREYYVHSSDKDYRNYNDVMLWR